MLPKKNRLNRQEFWQTKKAGQKLSLFPYNIIFCPSSIAKFSVVVSKKIARRAVSRNRLRRQIYHHLSQQQQNLKSSIIIYLQKNETDLSSLDQVLSKVS